MTHPRSASANLTLNLPVDNEYVVACNQCRVVAIIIRLAQVTIDLLVFHRS